ncbi:hypothetical protein MBLNU13_g02671t1 [Cladosporium sp. NU13]
MHRISTLSVLLAGANVLSLASAQDSSQSEDTTVVLTSTAPASTITVTGRTGTTTGYIDPEATSRPDGFPQDDPEVTAQAKRIAEACYPGFSEQKIDWSAPCPAVQIIQAECTWGPEVGEWVKKALGRPVDSDGPGFINDDWEQQPEDLQRACLCSSQYSDMVLGCGACLESHGVELADMATYLATSNATAVQKFEKMYCDAGVEPTLDNRLAAFDVLYGQDYDFLKPRPSVASTASDSLGNATAVSLYFTASVSSAYTVDMPTASSSASQTHANAWYTYTSLSTSDGLIVPTAIPERRVTASPPDASQSGADATGAGDGTATEAAGAMQTAMVRSGVGAGALGLAALVFAL